MLETLAMSQWICLEAVDRKNIYQHDAQDSDMPMTQTVECVCLCLGLTSM